MKDFTTTLEFRKAVVEAELWLINHPKEIDPTMTIVSQAKKMAEAQFVEQYQAMRGDLHI